MTSDPSHRLQEIGLETAQRLIDYDSYGKSESRAIAAMRRRHPGLDREQYAQVLADSIAVHKAAIEFVAANAQAFWNGYEQEAQRLNIEPIAAGFIESHPSFPPDLLVGTLQFVFYLYHLR